MKKMLLLFVTLALAVASAASSYHFSLFQPSYVGGKELKAGDYKLELNGDKATIKVGKETFEATVKVENGSEKFTETSVRYTSADGKMSVQEIRLGGTKTKLVFSN
ncbi:MAG TPA: hypothetical protein VMT15_01560 [Bryobacteraceae bacterium]|nr:hypothetical protein [Bryobacteraceae bacterium]